MKRSCVLIPLALGALVLSSCGRQPPPKEEVIAQVNGEPLYVKDYDRAIDVSSNNEPLLRRDPDALDAQLEMLIQKKLLIQEARKAELDREDRFSQTIKTFWEQTLIRDIIAKKEEEFNKLSEVTDAETKDLYDQISNRVYFSLIKDRNKEELERVALEKPGNILWEEEIGPLAYDDSLSELMLKIFGLGVGEKKIIQDDDMYYLVYMKKKETSPMPEYAQMRQGLEKKIRSMKVKDRFAEWLESLKGNAHVSINEDVAAKLKYRK